MEQGIISQELVLEKVRQRPGSLDNKAEKAVAEAIAIPNEARQTLPQQEDEFVSANVSVAQYVAWSPAERFQYLNDAEKVNARRVERQLQKMNAAWLMVIDGQDVAHGASIQTLRRKQQFNALCDKYGKYPFVFFNQRVLMIGVTALLLPSNLNVLLWLVETLSSCLSLLFILILPHARQKLNFIMMTPQ